MISLMIAGKLLMAGGPWCWPFHITRRNTRRTRNKFQQPAQFVQSIITSSHMCGMILRLLLVLFFLKLEEWRAWGFRTLNCIAYTFHFLALSMIIPSKKMPYSCFEKKKNSYLFSKTKKPEHKSLQKNFSKKFQLKSICNNRKHGKHPSSSIMSSIFFIYIQEQKNWKNTIGFKSPHPISNSWFFFLLGLLQGWWKSRRKQWWSRFYYCSQGIGRKCGCRAGE